VRRIEISVLLLLIILITPALSLEADIFKAVHQGDIDLVRELIKKDPACVNARGEYQRTPLIQAALDNRTDIFKLLLEEGSDFTLGNLEGMRPLHFVVFRGNLELTRLLLGRGAKVDHNENVSGMSPLHIAVRTGDTEMMELLIGKNADPTLKNKRGNDALMLGVLNNQPEAVSLLIARGAALNSRSRDGSTPLITAAVNGHMESVQMLIDGGADVNIRNQRGNTAAHAAQREGHKRIVERLIKAGAPRPTWTFPVMKGDFLGQEKPGLTPRIFAPGVVSTEKRELNAVFSPDGDEFYFTVTLPSGRWVIQVMKRIEDTWQKPITAGFSGVYSDVDMCMSHDGLRMFYSSNRPLEAGGKPKDIDIWCVTRDKPGAEWSIPTNPGPPVNSPGSEFYPSLTRQGHLYLQTEREEIFGAKDIYRSVYKNGKFEEPENLGQGVNSQYFEGDAMISPNEDFLILSVNKPGGLGEGDLYISFRRKDGSWAEGIHMGPDINTPAHENCPMLTHDGRYLFYTSANDIYWVEAGIIEKFRAVR